MRPSRIPSFSLFFFGMIAIVATYLVPSGVIQGSGSSAKTDTTSFTTRSAAAFELQDLDGRNVHLRDFNGKVVLLNFFATWCPPCRYEIPAFTDIQKRYAGRSVQFLGIVLDDDSLQTIKAWTESRHVGYPILLADAQRKILETYDVTTAIPVTFIIDRKGMIRFEYIPHRGDNPGAIIENKLKEILAEP